MAEEPLTLEQALKRIEELEALLDRAIDTIARRDESLELQGRQIIQLEDEVQRLNARQQGDA